MSPAAAAEPGQRPTVLVTRPRPQAVATARRLHQSGHRVLIDPLLVVQAVPFAPPVVDDVAAVLLTSANGALGVDPRLAGLPTFAVGRTTAAAATRKGFRDVRAADGDAAALARLVMAAIEPGAGALLHLCGEDVKPGLDEQLTEAGYAYRRLTVYRAAAATQLAARTLRALREDRLDAVLFYSPRTASVFQSLVAAAQVDDRLDHTTALCLSEDVAARLRDLAWRDVLVAERRSQDALLARLEGLLGTC